METEKPAFYADNMLRGMRLIIKKWIAYRNVDVSDYDADILITQLGIFPTQMRLWEANSVLGQRTMELEDIKLQLNDYAMDLEKLHERERHLKAQLASSGKRRKRPTKQGKP